MSEDAFWRSATLAFAAGALGGIANRLFLWLIGALGVTAALGVKFTPDLAKGWLYNGIVWGGIWGFIYLVPWRRSWALRGLVFGVLPSLVLLFILFPQSSGAGFLGLGLGTLTPVVVLVANWVWGLLASWWFDYVGGRAKVR